ncbi:type VI secretion system contractile sheath small subunit, partial [Pseudomonas gessardii]|nr:type VI secretion system contractile sheath small subunit [Pseudomonas gessardii]
MASNSFQNEVPKARVNIKLDLHTGGAQKKVELPLKLMVMGDYSNGKEQRPLSVREKVNIHKNNFDSVLGEFSPSLKLAVNNTLADDDSDTSVELNFQSMKDFEPEQVARQIPQLRALLAMRNLLRDLKSNLLDNVTFRHELERILKDDALSEELRAELAALARRPQKLSATPDLSGTVLPLCPITNSVSPNVRPFNSALPKVSA